MIQALLRESNSAVAPDGPDGIQPYLAPSIEIHIPICAGSEAWHRPADSVMQVAADAELPSLVACEGREGQLRGITCTWACTAASKPALRASMWWLST